MRDEADGEASGGAWPGDADRRGPAARTGRFADSIESRASWRAVLVAVSILTVSYGGPLILVVGLKPVTASLDSDRSVVALAAAMVWVGTGLGGIVMGWVADRVGARATVIFGAVMTALGLVVSSAGQVWTLYLGNLVLVGFLGGGALYAPLLVNVTRWFDRRRGQAIALMSSGQYVAGVVWPSVFERGIDRFGWQETMFGFAVLVAVVIVPLALLVRPSPAPRQFAVAATGGRHRARVLGLRANLVQALLGLASFLCCVPMAMPAGHLVALCSDLGFPAAQGAAMLSVLLGCAFVSRVFWGWIADRIGGLGTVFLCSACQALAIVAFSITQNEIGLFTVSAAYGLGFSGLIPAYIVAIRELFPSSEASWRLPLQLFTGMSGMAFGSWFAGALYDSFGYYAPAFAAGAVFNLANLMVVGFLVLRQLHRPRVLVEQSA
ncbi:MAG TPA: MFS transporter [Stellaceae bacterium]|nr:MFS transporter [Stellaceae bacterium]